MFLCATKKPESRISRLTFPGKCYIVFNRATRPSDCPQIANFCNLLRACIQGKGISTHLKFLQKQEYVIK